jgi:hypothetical protein
MHTLPHENIVMVKTLDAASIRLRSLRRREQSTLDERMKLTAWDKSDTGADKNPCCATERFDRLSANGGDQSCALDAGLERK